MDLNYLVNTVRAKLILVVGIGLIIFSCKNEIQNEYRANTDRIDSIFTWVEQSTDVSFAINRRKENLSAAYELCDSIKSDSLKTRVLLKVADAAFKLGDTSFFKIVNRTAQEASIKARDTFGIGDTHWNLGAFYANQEVMDSAYFHYHKAYENFQSVNHEFYSGKMLYNMAVIQKDIKDYTGSEILTFRAIKKFEELNKPINMYLCYNLLGVIFNEVKEFDKAIFYYEKALVYLNDVDNKGTFKEGSFNNLGLVYQNLNKYDKSISQFGKALKNDNLKSLNINLYARLLDNMAYSKLLRKDSIDLYPLFLKALKIRDSVGNNFGVSISKYHLSMYYLSKTDTTKAILYAKESYELATEVNNNKIVLKSLKLLAEIDQKNSDQYFENYIALNDICRTMSGNKEINSLEFALKQIDT